MAYAYNLLFLSLPSTLSLSLSPAPTHPPPLSLSLSLSLSFLLLSLSHSHQIKQPFKYHSSDRLALALQSVDYKFLLIPVVFIVLRFWSFLGDVLNVFLVGVHIPQWLALCLITLEVCMFTVHIKGRLKTTFRILLL